MIFYYPHIGQFENFMKDGALNVVGFMTVKVAILVMVKWKATKNDQLMNYGLRIVHILQWFKNRFSKDLEKAL